MSASRIILRRALSNAGGLVIFALSILVGWRRRRDDHVANYPHASTPPTSPLGRAFVSAALHERILVLYVLGLLVAVAHGGGEERLRASLWLGADLVLLVAAITTVRAPLLANRVAAALTARLIVFAGLIVTFLQLQVILPAARHGSVDATLYALDLRLFGVEPASSWDGWVNPATTEWFSFFYFSYFVLLAVHVFPFIFLERRLRLVGEFALGMVAVYCIGQFTYVLVPGFGPYRSLSFAHTLDGPIWWPLVQSGASAVKEGSRTDIFPSLHTAGPAFLTLFSFRHRALRPFRYTWPIVGFFTIQIMLATMFLRWHYLIDVIAGVVLAVFAAKLATRAAGEEKRRANAGHVAVWTTLRWSDSFALSHSADDHTDA